MVSTSGRIWKWPAVISAGDSVCGDAEMVVAAVAAWLFVVVVDVLHVWFVSHTALLCPIDCLIHLRRLRSQNHDACGH